MRKLIWLAVFILTALIIIAYPSFANASEGKEAASSADIFMGQTPDPNIERLRRFLASYDSPLANYAPVFVEKASRYNLDWKLIPAITGVESTFGKAIPFNSYNAYGWANGEYSFKSWGESIEVVAKTLRENYVNRGADTVEKIAPIYAPPSQTWAGKVLYFMDKIENFAPNKTIALELSL